MDLKAPSTFAAAAAADRVYEDFVPPFEWSRDGARDKLVLVLPGFRREQLKVQVTSKHTLRISAERPLRDNIWRRFSKEFHLFPDSDTNQISARFEGIRLSVMIPKTTSQAELPTVETPTQKAGQEVPSDSRNDREAEPDANKAKTGELNNEGSNPKPNQEHGAGKIMRRLKTRVVETLTASDHLDDKEKEERAEAAGDDLGKGAWKLKKLMSLIVAMILLVLVISLFIKNTIKFAHGGFKFQEL